MDSIHKRFGHSPIQRSAKSGEDSPASKIFFIPREDGLTVFVSNGKEAWIAFVKAEDSWKGLRDI